MSDPRNNESPRGTVESQRSSTDIDPAVAQMLGIEIEVVTERTALAEDMDRQREANVLDGLEDQLDQAAHSHDHGHDHSHDPEPAPSSDEEEPSSDTSIVGQIRSFFDTIRGSFDEVWAHIQEAVAPLLAALGIETSLPYNTSHELPEAWESRELGDLEYQGPNELTNFMRIPDSAPEYNQSDPEPHRWYETDRGIYWYDGVALLSTSKVNFLIRDGYRPSMGSIENYLDNRMVTFTFPSGETTRVHPLYAERLSRAWSEMEEAGINYHVETASGFNYRPARGGGIARPIPYLSNHWGFSIDYNSAHNRWDPDVTPDYSDEMMRIMARNGIRPPIIWGDDHMHFDMPAQEDGTFRDSYLDELERHLA